MLLFNGNEYDWSGIASVNRDRNEVSITTTDNETYVINVYATESDAIKVHAAIEAARVASSVGGVVIEIIIDDL